MDKITDKKYLLQSMAELVRDENNRIISQRLATSEELAKLTESINEAIASDSFNKDEDTVLNVLSFVHRNLASIKLPGDFQKVACGMQDAFCIVLDVPITEELEIVRPEKKDEIVMVVEEKKEKEKDKKKEKAKKVKSMILEKLEKVAYSLGCSGNQEAAYLVERCASDIDAFAAEADMWGEMSNMEAQQRRPQVPPQVGRGDAVGAPSTVPMPKTQTGTVAQPAKQPTQMTQKQVAELWSKMTPEERQRRSDQVTQQVKQQYPKSPQARREQQHQQQAKQQQPAAQPVAQQAAPQAKQPTPTAAQQPQAGQQNMKALFNSAKSNGHPLLTEQQFNAQVKRHGLDKVRKYYKI